MTQINLCNVARFYREQRHQTDALTWLQSQIPAATLDQFAQKWRSAPADLVSLDDLLKITTVAPKSLLEKFVDPLNKAFLRFNIATPLRVAHFVAQLCHESGEFQYVEEIESGANYEWREDLGNTQEGDGVRFKGRGLIQITGRKNYQDASRYLGVDFIDQPERLAELPHAVNSACWYWDSRQLSRLADINDFDGITFAINGGYRGYDDRLKYLKRCKDVLL